VPPKTDPQTEPPAEPSGEAEEAAFWTRLDERIEAGVNKVIDDRIKTAGSSSRNGGRTTLPKIMADLLFPPGK
jgi:hypothetical protein